MFCSALIFFVSGYSLFIQLYCKIIRLQCEQSTALKRHMHRRRNDVTGNMLFKEIDAFGELKSLFVSTPILKHPNPSEQFIVEVDASDTGVRAVLS